MQRVDFAYRVFSLVVSRLHQRRLPDAPHAVDCARVGWCVTDCMRWTTKKTAENPIWAVSISWRDWDTLDEVFTEALAGSGAEFMLRYIQRDFAHDTELALLLQSTPNEVCIMPRDMIKCRETEIMDIEEKWKGHRYSVLPSRRIDPALQCGYQRCEERKETDMYRNGWRKYCSMHMRLTRCKKCKEKEAELMGLCDLCYTLREK